MRQNGSLCGNGLNCPLRVSKNSSLPFFEKINNGKELKENIENNLVLCIDHRKAFAIKSIPRSVFRNPSHNNKIRLFSISVKF